jgi:hypothetical protein
VSLGRYDVRETIHGTKLFGHPELGELNLTFTGMRQSI